LRCLMADGYGHNMVIGIGGRVRKARSNTII
jgi:hypothetical protein